jgi:hypothetical protein
VTETLREDDRVRLKKASGEESASDFVGNAPLIEEKDASEVDGDESESEELLAAQADPREAWMSGSGSVDPLAPAEPKARTFAAHLDERKAGSDRTRLQAMRQHFGWKALRPRWWNQQARDYQTAHKAEKLRYEGFGRLAKTRFGNGKDPDDRTVVNLYSQLKRELKSAAGYNPFTSKFWKYWGAKRDLKEGKVLQHENKLSSLDRFLPHMPTIAQNALHKEQAAQKADGDLAEIHGLLGGGEPQTDSQPAGPGLDRPSMVPDEVEEQGEPSSHESKKAPASLAENDDYLDIGEDDNASESGGAGFNSDIALHRWLENFDAKDNGKDASE